MKTDKMKNVLIALDFDPSAQKVAEAGYALAKTMNAEVTLLHVILDPVNYSSPGHITVMGFGGYMDPGTIQTDTVAAMKKASLQFLDKSREYLGDKTIHTRVGEGDCADSILKAAKDLHADIIVVGSHSRKWLENIVMGSVSEKVLHHTTIPLLIIPTRKHN
jgi:nucleotide-binding universal stress UspA family protein